MQNCRNFRQRILPLRSVCACLQHYLSYSLQMSLSPFHVYIHHEKPVIRIKEICALQMQYHCFQLDCFILFLCDQVFPNYSNFTREIVIMFFSPVGYKKCCILKTHKISKTFCSLYTVLQSVYCTISKLLNKYKYILYYIIFLKCGTT